jgi:hypothetical protein
MATFTSSQPRQGDDLTPGLESYIQEHQVDGEARIVLTLCLPASDRSVEESTVGNHGSRESTATLTVVGDSDDDSDASSDLPSLSDLLSKPKAMRHTVVPEPAQEPRKPRKPTDSEQLVRNGSSNGRLHMGDSLGSSPGKRSTVPRLALARRRLLT